MSLRSLFCLFLSGRFTKVLLYMYLVQRPSPKICFLTEKGKVVIKLQIVCVLHVCVCLLTLHFFEALLNCDKTNALECVGLGRSRFFQEAVRLCVQTSSLRPGKF